MASGDGLREFSRTVDHVLTKTPITVNLKYDVPVKLNIASHGVTEDRPSQSLMKVFLSHAAFKTVLQPDASFDDDFYARCSAEVNAINLFFPDIKSDSIRISFTAWLAFICVFDDMLERMPTPAQEATLRGCIELLKGCDPVTTSIPDPHVRAMAQALQTHCSRYLSHRSANVFFRAIAVVLEAHRDEIDFLEGRLPNGLSTYMTIRSRTIALLPFFEVIKCEYLPQPLQDNLNPVWGNLQHAVCCAAGLQNDLIGLARDLDNGERLNAVMVLLPSFGTSSDQLDRDALFRAVAQVSAEHDENVSQAMVWASRLVGDASGSDAEAISNVARQILMLCETHLKWCTSSKRYQIEEGVCPVSPPLSATDIEPPLSATDIEPLPSATDIEPPLSATDIDPPLPVTDIDPPVRTQLIHSDGIFHGLPVYNPPAQGLTAMVTGATGVSGYNMVKVLAASANWDKIYCLSSRPPPANFFSDLGPGANKVTHLAVDFLSDPSIIAEALSVIKSVDHIFYFSYMQPPPKGDVLDLWANATDLATINTTLLTNLLASLPLTPLRPRHILLQTGSKHYAFYLGPSLLPSFESDPRIPLSSSTNFYYAQEDALAAYCTAWSCSHTILRPSYIIGAVPDGSLNHLVGIAVYAAVQAHLGGRLEFPGCWRAWDREQVQSSGRLNAYFGEWLGVTAGGRKGGEAFNVHDGGSFTWGRAWPMVAGWFGVGAGWSPPGEEGVREVRMEGGVPRGYGPQMVFRSTFSLLEWSLRPEVEEAWKVLRERHGLVLDPFDDRYRARIFSFSDSALIGDAPMTISIHKAREFGFFGTVDSYRSIFDTMGELGRLKLIVPPVGEFEGEGGEK
ncbi:Iridoid synthase [Podospora conica]|nr:Iridoid synthase [Schizothecium conicum]